MSKREIKIETKKIVEKMQDFVVKLDDENLTIEITYPKTGLAAIRRISDDLQRFVSANEPYASFIDVAIGFWAYVKRNGLQHPRNKQYVIPDQRITEANYNCTLNLLLLISSHFQLTGLRRPFRGFYMTGILKKRRHIQVN